MKQVVFIGKTNGYVTPAKQADFLSKHAHLEGIIGFVKYYTFRGQGYKVIHVAGKVAQVNKMDADEVKKIVSCAKIKFGGF